MKQDEIYLQWIRQIQLNPAIKETQWYPGEVDGDLPADMTLDAALWLVMVQDWIARLTANDWDVSILIEDDAVPESMVLDLNPEEDGLDIEEMEDELPYDLSSDEGVLQSMIHLFGITLDLAKPRSIATSVTLTNPTGGVYDFYIGVQP